jgi:N-methylhydantoinase A
VLRAGESLSAEAVARDVAELATEARATLGDAGAGADAGVRVALDLRYRGQSFELAVAAAERPDLAAAREAFAAAHEERYGFRDPGGEVELVTVRVSAVRPGPSVALAAEHGAREPAGRREAVVGGERVHAAVFAGELAHGARIEGPAIWQGPEATLAVPRGWAGAVDATGTIVLERA